MLTHMRSPTFLGIYSCVQPPHNEKAYYFAWEDTISSRIVQKLDKAYQPAEQQHAITLEEFTRRFTHEPSILAMPLVRMDDIWKRRKEEPPPKPVVDAEAEAKGMSSEELRTEKKIRDLFLKALPGLKRPKERDAALAAIEQIASTRQDITPSHKHMFRDFGVTLRQMNLLPQALLCSKRVVEMSPEDDHGHFNLARILCLMEMFDEAIEHLDKAMRTSPKEKAYVKFMAHINKKRMQLEMLPYESRHSAGRGTVLHG
ncbi:MAG: tetratricopeptide repeat protein [Desulfovibrio sp.]|jgi:tetratricopeptide (TPR) repeat protein|nr:tetratricopeptide repeat protein [Desulfovibrio sp.]